MRAVVTSAPGVMELRDVPDPSPGPGEARVDLTAIGLCGSDFHLFDGSHPYAHFPQVQGHELVGVVADLPVGYRGTVRTGDAVAIEPLLWCGNCFACRRGRTNCCAELRVLGAHAPGGLTESISVPAHLLHPTGDLPVEVAVLTEPISIGLHAVNRSGIRDGDRVAVFGAGPIGLAATLAAADRGAVVLVADRLADRLPAARRMGAAVTVDTSRHELADAVAEFAGAGLAAVVEATGVPQLVRSAVDLVAASGTVVLVGISTDPVAIPVSEYSRKELNVLGARNSAGEFGASIDLLGRHREAAAAMVTHVFDLADTPTAIALAMAHPEQVEKVVISADPLRLAATHQATPAVAS